jgi:hypothetical protein
MKLSDQINLAADTIQRRGWTQIIDTTGNGFVNDPWGDKNTDAPVCLEGGIAAAAGVSVNSPDFTDCPAYQAVLRYLEGTPSWTDTKFPYDRLYSWNDAPGRTEGDVVAVLRAAAVVEEARERQSVEIAA